MGVSLDASALVPLHVLERVCAIPYAIEGNALLVAIADPGDVQGIDELRLATAHQVRLGVASRDDIESELKRLVRAAESYGARAILKDIDGLEAVAYDDDDGADLEAEDGISDAPLVRLVNAIIFQAAEDGASDIHFEPQESELIVRLRIDGVLHEVQRIPKRMAAGVTARLKVLAKLDIAQRRTPQDGRISLNAAAAGRTLDVRIATLPTVDGEGVVMRLLDKSKRAPTLEELGLPEEMRTQMAEIVSRPTGAVLVTGPTGSGKSTTLYAALNSINNPEIKVITVEDPVEFRLAGVNQVQINNRAGMTFAAALRAILRSDPDVVMVGEIRDSETAKTSIEAALTGHLVLSTLHTNDAPSVLTRLNEMGVPPFLTGSAVSAVLAQRLARKLCTHCSERYIPSPEDLVRARVSPEVAGRDRRDRTLPQARLPTLRADRLQGPDRHLPAADDDRERAAARVLAGEPRGDRARGDRRGHGHALGRRPGQGDGGADVARRALPHHRLSPTRYTPKAPCGATSAAREEWPVVGLARSHHQPVEPGENGAPTADWSTLFE